MMKFYAALAWAAAIMLVAIGNASGLIADDAAQTLFAVLPGIAVISLRGPNCSPRQRRAAA